MLLSVQDVIQKGLDMVRISKEQQQLMSQERCTEIFRKHYGSSPLDLADQWYDLTTTDVPLAALSKDEKTMQGFECFMRAHYFLWSYPRNAEQFARMFGVHEKKVRGKFVWDWIERVAALEMKKIKFPTSLGDDPPVIAFSVDGTDLKCNEPHNHPRYPIDSQMKSDKFNKAGWKYLVAMLVHKAQIVAVLGPYKASKSELTVFCENLKEKLRSLPGVVASGDLGFRTSETDETEPPLFCYPNSMDPKDVRNYKSRVRCRQESLFGRLKFFRILSDTFTYSKEKHNMAFRAVAVTVQYQMDNGSPVFTV